MTPPRPTSDLKLPDPAVAAPPAPDVEQETFVINLCSSTTPMALSQPQLAELKSYTFFVSRRLEDGRERFRLHMGYFDTQLQAEDMLPLVRDIYPGAWAGEAPGKRLRARGAAAKIAASPAKQAAKVPDAAVLANAPTLNPPPESTLIQPVPPVVLELAAATPASQPTPTPAPAIASAPAPEPALTLELVAEAPAPAPQEAPTPVTAPTAAATANPVPRTPGSRRDANLPFDQRSNVREVLKSLDESARTRMPPAGPAVRQPGVLPESQVMRLLEEKRGDPLNTMSTPAAFAVQLQWSVQPIDLAAVPPLAIFGAYMLYTVEGSREGRRWYGLRLGFFTDANSAKTVAQYVRSEFTAVAVVPVSLKERDNANGANSQGNAPRSDASADPADAAAPKVTERLPDQSAEFKLLDDTAETPMLSTALDAAFGATTTPSAKAKPAAAGAKGPIPGRPRVVKNRGNRVHANEKRGPKTLEETLEILGADQLQMEGAKKKRTSDSPVRHLDVKVQKNSAFSRLLDRLAERNR